MGSTAKHTFLGVVLAGGLFWSTGCARLTLFPEQAAPPPPDTAYQERAALLAHYSRAMIADLQDDHETAILHYHAAAMLDGSRFDLLHREIVSLLKHQQSDQAEKRLRQAMPRHAHDVRAHLLLALVQRSRNDFPAAREAFLQAARLDPHNPMHVIEAAALYVRENQSDQARTLLLAAYERVPEENQLPLHIALAEISLRDAAHATSRREAIDLTPELERLHAAIAPPDADEMLLYLMGDLFILLSDLENAIACFTRIEERNPSDLRVRQRLSLSFASLGDRVEAIRILETLSLRSPENIRLLHYKAELLEQEDRIEEAITVYEHIISIQPGDSRAYLRLAFLHMGREELEPAEDVLIRGQASLPDDAQFDEMLAYIHLAREHFPQAMRAFDRAARAYEADDALPVLSHFPVNYAIALQMNDRPGEAARQLATAALNDPGALRGYFNYAWQQTNEIHRAATLETLRIAAPDLPRESWIHIQAGALFKRSSSYHDAVNAFQRAHDIADQQQLEPEDLGETFFFWFGAASERIHEYHQAEELFLRAIALKPDFADAHNYLAYMLAEQAVQLDMAYDHIGVALAIDPDNAAYIDTRGWIYYQQGRYELALDDIERAAEKLPEDPVINDHLGDIHYKLGNLDQALHFWTIALEHGHETPEAIQAKLDAHQPAPPDPEPEPAPQDPDEHAILPEDLTSSDDERSGPQGESNHR
ncbi:MAG TPA: tetratricopeptide repeat protein [Kiritimatiellia bacterium]|nr:tetratricopeptide repeat protein [Kiritimatiellia bacterium]